MGRRSTVDVRQRPATRFPDDNGSEGWWRKKKRKEKKGEGKMETVSFSFCLRFACIQKKMERKKEFFYESLNGVQRKRKKKRRGRRRGEEDMVVSKRRERMGVRYQGWVEKEIQE